MGLVPGSASLGVNQTVNSGKPFGSSGDATSFRLVWWVLLAGVALRVVFLLISVNNGGDALDRVGKTEEWLENMHLQFFYGAWLPLHFWMMGGLGVLLGNVELAGRLLSLVTGAGSMWLVWRIARRAYGETAGLLSLCAIAFYTLHVAYSTTSSAEVPFLFFSLLGLDLLFAHQQDGSWARLVASGICFTVSAAIRYEAWVLIAAAGLVLIASPPGMLRRSWWSTERLGQLAAFGLAAGAWPVFWMTYTYMKLGHPLYYVMMQREWVPGINAGTTLTYRVSVAPVALVLGLSLPVVAASLYALWLAVRESAGRPLAFVFLCFASVQFYQTVSDGMWPSARFTITQGVLLAILSGRGLERMANRFVPRWSNGKVCVALSAVLAANLLLILAFSEIRHPYSEKFGSVSPRLRFAHYINDVGDFLRPRLGASDPVVIDNYNVESAFVAVATGLPLRPDENVFLTVKRDRNTLRSFVERWRPRYAVYAPQGTLHTVLPLPGDCSAAEVWGVEFRCVFKNDVYQVYELTYR